MGRVLARFYGVTFLYTLSMAAGLPIVPQHLHRSFGASLGFIGFLAGVYGAMQIVLRLPMGDMADRRGRKPSLVLTFMLTALAGGIYVVAPDAWWLLPAQALFGFASGIFWVAANAYLFDHVDADDLPRATSDYALVVGLAFLVGPPLGGVVADRWGFPAALSIFVWSSLAGILLLSGLPERAPEGAAARGHIHRRAWRILKDPDIRVSALGTLVYSTMLGTLTAFYPVYIAGLAYTAFAVGVFIAVRQGTSLAARVALPWALRRWGPRHVLLVGMVATALGTGATPWASAALPIGALAVVVGLGLGMLIPANLTLVARGAPPHEKGLANGIYGTALGLGQAVAQWVLGPIGGAYGIAWAFWGTAAAALAGALLLGTYVRRHPARARRIPPPPVPEGDA